MALIDIVRHSPFFELPLATVSRSLVITVIEQAIQNQPTDRHERIKALAGPALICPQMLRMLSLAPFEATLTGSAFSWAPMAFTLITLAALAAPHIPHLPRIGAIVIDPDDFVFLLRLIEITAVTIATLGAIMAPSALGFATLGNMAFIWIRSQKLLPESLSANLDTIITLTAKIFGLILSVYQIKSIALSITAPWAFILSLIGAMKAKTYLEERATLATAMEAIARCESLSREIIEEKYKEQLPAAFNNVCTRYFDLINEVIRYDNLAKRQHALQNQLELPNEEIELTELEKSYLKHVFLQKWRELCDTSRRALIPEIPLAEVPELQESRKTIISGFILSPTLVWQTFSNPSTPDSLDTLLSANRYSHSIETLLRKVHAEALTPVWYAIREDYELDPQRTVDYCTHFAKGAILFDELA